MFSLSWKLCLSVGALEGYGPDLNQVFVDIEECEKENQITLHSEKMALAFGLMSIPQGILIYLHCEKIKKLL